MQKGNQKSGGGWQEKEQSQISPLPPFAALSHSQTAPAAAQLGNVEGKAGGTVGIVPAISTKPWCTRICCAGILVVPAADGKTSGRAAGQLPAS